MVRQVIGVGSVANDGTGDNLRAAGQKINANFTELYGSKSPIQKAQKILRSAYRGKLVGLMPNPVPVATQGGDNANSTIITDQNAFSSQITHTDPRITVYSGQLAPAEPSYFKWITSSSQSQAMGASFRFATDAEAFEIRMTNANWSGFRVMVDGEWTQTADYTITGVGNGASFIFYKFDFGAGNGRPRVIDVSVNTGFWQLYGLNVGPSGGTTAANNPYRIWKAPLPDEPKVLVWGDSWVGGVGIGTTNCRSSFVHKAGEYLGIKSIIGSGVGQQGYLTVGNDGDNRTFRQRLLAATPSDIEKFGELDMVIIGPTGMNDSGTNTTALQAEVTLFANEVIARQPNALIVAFGAQRTPAAITPPAINAAIKAGWLAASAWDNSRMTFVDTFGPPNWYDTSLSVGNMQDAIYNSINAGDDAHPNLAGHIYTGRRVADSIVDWLNTLVS